jgi:hypothetical protein
MKLSILLHTLGLDARHTTPWRNHYVTGAEDPEVAALVAAGLMEPARRPGFLADDDRVFRVTTEGESVARVERARLYPKPSRSAARYDAWLAGDGCGVSFGEFLKRRMYQECM